MWYALFRDKRTSLNFNLVRHFFKKKLVFLISFILNLHRNFILKNETNVSKKHGFSFSQKDLLEYNNFELISHLKKKKIINKFFNISFIEKMIFEFKKNKKWATELWIIISFTFWLRSKLND